MRSPSAPPQPTSAVFTLPAPKRTAMSAALVVMANTAQENGNESSRRSLDVAPVPVGRSTMPTTMQSRDASDCHGGIAPMVPQVPAQLGTTDVARGS